MKDFPLNELLSMTKPGQGSRIPQPDLQPYQLQAKPIKVGNTVVHWSPVAYIMQKGTSGENFLNYINSIRMEWA